MATNDGIPAADEQRPLNLQRAIVVGVGGTGAEVISRLRRLIVDRFGSFEALPIVKFLYIDTDPNFIRRMTTGNDATRLSEAEFVDAQVPDASGLYRGIREGSYSHYDWFTEERLRSFPNISEGAGTIRQLGRLCFWQHRPEIQKKFSDLVRSVNADANANFMRNTHHQEVDAGINVHIISSLAGGTGAGCFLDMAYLARDVLARLNIHGSHQFAGYLMLPGAFAHLGVANAMANGYAALRELNYLSYRYIPGTELAPLYGQPQWHAKYAPDDSDTTTSEKPPFDFCYLLDSSNPSVQLKRDDIFAMVARNLFHDFTLEFASWKRTLRANIEKRITRNDPLDCPNRFMSFGLSAVYFPRHEVQELLKHQLALRAVQTWIENTDEPIKVLQVSSSNGNSSGDDITTTLTQTANSPEVQEQVKADIISNYLPNNGFRLKDLLASVVASQKIRLTGVPYDLRETVKEQWISEKWERPQFKARLTATWERWRSDFSDDGVDPTAWGERIRWMYGNANSAHFLYSENIYRHAMDLFRDTERGPAWALAFLKIMRGPLAKAKDEFNKQADDASCIAAELGDIFLIEEAARKSGPALSENIVARIGQELQKLDEVAEENIIRWRFGGEERIRIQAYSYLTWCALWCRARVEERARRLAAAMCESLINDLKTYENKIREMAIALAQTRSQLLQLALSWGQKGVATENVGRLLFNPILIEVLDQRISAERGEAYDPQVVAKKALEKLNKPLEEMTSTDTEALRQALLEAAGDAIGALSEDDLSNTNFAAYDLLSAQCGDNAQQVESVLTDTIEKGRPFVQFNRNPPGGHWQPDGVFPFGLLPAKVAGVRGAEMDATDGQGQEKVQDAQRMLVLDALARMQWNVGNEVHDMRDSDQIPFVQECGGFPLRALAGIEEMRAAYERHRAVAQNPPLHIVRDEMATRYPDIMPPVPKNLQRALTLQSVGLALDLIGQRTFHNAETGRDSQLYAYCRYIAATKDEEAVELGDTIPAIGMKLAYDTNLADEVESTLAERIKQADAAGKQAMYDKLLAYIEKVKAGVRKDGRDPATDDAYKIERDRVLAFMSENGLEQTVQPS